MLQFLEQAVSRLKRLGPMKPFLFKWINKAREGNPEEFDSSRKKSFWGQYIN